MQQRTQRRIKVRLERELKQGVKGFLFTRELDGVGRITIPIDVRTACGWKEGDTLMLAAVDKGVVIKSVNDMMEE